MTTFAQRSFAGGEISPALYARCDTVKYATGARTLRNMLVMRHGGATSRSGTTFIATTYGFGGISRLIPFIFNSSQTYVLEFSNFAMRVYKAGVQLTDVSRTITGISNASIAVITSASHGFSNGDEVQISGVTGPMGQYLNNRNFRVQNVTTNTFQIVLDTTSVGAYVSGGTASRVYTVVTPYNAADLATLKFVQSADVLTIVHPSYAPREVARTGDTSWTISTVSYTPTTTSPTSVTLSGAAPGGGTTLQYVVTAINDSTHEESLPSAASGFLSAASLPTQSSAVTISWTPVAGCSNYNVYRSTGNSTFGFIGVSQGTSLIDIGQGADGASTPPIANNPFPSAGNYPSTVAYFQQRLALASSNNNPESIWLSRIRKFHNFSTSSSLQDDDSISFRLVGRQVNSVKHMVDAGRMLVFTSGGEWAMNGDASGTLTPIAINPKQYSYNGASDLVPIVIDNSVLYVQARGSFVRDLSYDFQIDGYKGNDLTIFSSHLFEGNTLVDWTFTQIPHSIVWAVRSDGTLLGLTYVRDQQIVAWHRHDFSGGFVENVCSVPEGNTDVLYLVVRRVVNGQSVRYVERMTPRFFSDVIDFNGMDASLTYDGRNFKNGGSLTLTTVTVSGGTLWDSTESLTLTASSALFSSGDVGNAVYIDIYDSHAVYQDTIRFTITGYTSPTVVTVTASKTVPASIRNVGTGIWAKAIKQVFGLWHLEGKQVSVFGDRFVVGSPNNASYPVYTVTNGSITLDQPYAVLHVGIPFIADLETLDIDTPQGVSMVDKKKLISRITCHVDKSRGLWIGPKPPTDDTVDPLENMTELKIRSSENYNDPVSLATDTVEINLKPEWNSNGRVFIRQVDPLPLTVLSVSPTGLVPIGRG